MSPSYKTGISQEAVDDAAALDRVQNCYGLQASSSVCVLNG